MAELLSLLPESSSGKVAAVFASEASARRAAGALRTALDLSDAQVQVVTPADRHPGRKLEPESHGIFRTMLRAHARLGLLGLATGAALFGALWWAGVPMVAQSPGFAAFAILFFGAIGGLMAGGLLTLRPDHDPYILLVQEALAGGRCAVVVHALSSTQKDAAEAWLRDASDEVVATAGG